MSTGMKKHSGAVSIFMVVFMALLVTVVTVSFMRLMVRDQQRASDSDLSQSAYDSAMAGVEDAKRALTKYSEGSMAFRSTVRLQEKC
jgi:Tfp pilus assembly protein PilX